MFHGHGGCTDDSGVVSEDGFHDLCAVEGGFKGVFAGALYEGIKDKFLSIAEGSAVGDHFGIEGIDDGGGSIAEVASDIIEQTQSQFVALFGGVINFEGTEFVFGAVGDLDNGFGAAGDGSFYVAADGSGTGVGFNAAVISAAAFGAFEIDDHVAEFPGGFVGSEVEFVVDDDAASDAGAEGEEDHGVYFAAGPDPPFAIGCGVGVVNEGDRHCDVFLKDVAGGNVMPAGEVWSFIDNAFAAVQGSGTGHSDGFYGAMGFD